MLVKVSTQAWLPAPVMPSSKPLTWVDAHAVPFQFHTVVVQVLPDEQLVLAVPTAQASFALTAATLCSGSAAYMAPGRLCAISHSAGIPRLRRRGTP